jgi:hypothetical protein
MAWKNREKGLPQYQKLQSQLVNSKLQTENNPLYQTVKELINAAQDFKDLLENTVKKTDKIDLANQVSGLLLAVNGGVETSYYFPVITDIANITSRTAYYSIYFFANNMVFVAGKLNIKATAAAVLTELEITLPKPSNFQTSDQLQGTINGIPLDGSTEGWAGILTGNVSNEQARVQYYPQNTDNCDCRFMLSYRVI